MKKLMLGLAVCAIGCSLATAAAAAAETKRRGGTITVVGPDAVITGAPDLQVYIDVKSAGPCLSKRTLRFAYQYADGSLEPLLRTAQSEAKGNAFVTLPRPLKTGVVTLLVTADSKRREVKGTTYRCRGVEGQDTFPVT